MDDNFETGIEFLRKKKCIGKLISTMEIPHFPHEKNHFKSLIKYVIYQQLSIKSARKIYDRLILLFNKKNISPNNFKLLKQSDLQSVGISKPKIKYMNEIANTFINDKYFLKNVDSLNNDEIMNELTKIKGVGPWTAEMFLMFTLHRLNVFSLKDLGLQKGIQKLFNLNEIPSFEFMIEKSNKWAPYQTIACLYLWKLIDGNNFDW